MATMLVINVHPKSETHIDEIWNEEDPRRKIGLIFRSDMELTVSDGHHTMEELYEHRFALFMALCKAYDSYITPLSYPHVRCWKSLKHNDGSSYEGWFIMGLSTQKIPFNNDDPIEKQHIAYHLPMRFWAKCDVVTLEYAPFYDGFTPNDVIERLVKL